MRREALKSVNGYNLMTSDQTAEIEITSNRKNSQRTRETKSWKFFQKVEKNFDFRKFIEEYFCESHLVFILAYEQEQVRQHVKIIFFNHFDE